MQGGIGAADLDGEVGAESAGGLADAFGDLVGAGVERGVGAVPAGGVEADVEGVDGGDTGAAQLGQSGGEQADDALPEDGDVLAEVDVAYQDGVVGDGADPGEGARQRVESGREGVTDDTLGGDDTLAAMPPYAPYEVTSGKRSGHAVQFRETSTTSPTSGSPS